MNEREIMMFEKIKFINDNKEVIKNNILERINYKNTNTTVLSVLFILLVNENDLNSTDEFKGLITMCETKYKNIVVQLTDIFGIIKSYIKKIYSGTLEEIQFIDKITEYDKFIKIIENEEIKTYKKAVSY